MSVVTLPAFATGGGYGGEGDHGYGYGDSAQVEVTGSIPQTCEWVEVPPDTNIGALATGLMSDLGQLSFKCNFASSQYVDVKMKSEKGGLDRIGGPELVAYQAAWERIAGGAYQNVSGWTGSGQTYNTSSGSNGEIKSGLFKVKVTGPTAGLPAGTYKDTLTFSISP